MSPFGRSLRSSATTVLSVLVPTAYRRRLGPDAAKLPGGFTRVVDDVITFADPALASEVASRAIWTALSASWNG
jgi:hypothetical protein